MDTTKQELERAFLDLQDLKYIGIALMEFALSRSASDKIIKTEEGGFRIGTLGKGFVEFRFREGLHKIRMLVNLEPDTIELRDKRFLLISDEHPYPVCEIESPGQLLSAATYIESAYAKYLATRYTSSSAFDESVN